MKKKPLSYEGYDRESVDQEGCRHAEGVSDRQACLGSALPSLVLGQHRATKRLTVGQSGCLSSEL